MQFTIEFKLNEEQKDRNNDNNAKERSYLIYCKLPLSYPSFDCNKHHKNSFIVRIIAPKSNDFDNKTIETANKAILDYINNPTNNIDLSNPILFELIDWISTEIVGILQTKSENQLNIEKKHQKMCKSGLNSKNGLILRRAFIWFHHIYSSKKKQTIRNLAMKWKIHGFCVTGKPGFIVYEGIDYNVKQCVSHLKSLHWQRMIVRHSELETYENAELFAKNECFNKWHFFDYPSGTKGGMKQLNACLTKGNGICNDNGKDLSKYFALITQIDRTIDNAEFDQITSDILDNMDKNNNNNNNNELKEMKISETDSNDANNYRFVTKQGNIVLVNVRVTPNAKQNQIVNLKRDIDSNSNEINIRISAVAKNNAANNELCSFVASLCRVKTSKVSVKHGHKSRNKTIAIDVSDGSREIVTVNDIVARLS